MDDIDDILRKSSSSLFNSLTEEHYKILKILARDGPQNLTQIDKYDRWGIRLRLFGSSKTLGLIPNHYVLHYKINKKEVNYALTLKGLLAVLAKTKFENVYMVKKYEKFLKKIIKKTKLVRWSRDFIKYEIALILYFNYLQGLDWTKFRYLRAYWDEYKTYGEHVMRTFFLGNYFWTGHAFEEYEIIKRKYLTLFSILDHSTFVIEWGKPDIHYVFSKLLESQSFRIYVDRWHLYIDSRFEGELEDYSLERADYVPFGMENLFPQELEESRREATIILQKNGYEMNSN